MFNLFIVDCCSKFMDYTTMQEKATQIKNDTVSDLIGNFECDWSDDVD